MTDKKKILIGVLCVLVAIMAIGYALLAQQLNINGIASIDSTWKVEITNIDEKNRLGGATSKATPSYTSTTAKFSVGLTQPGDSITYYIEISNLGTLKAKVDSINVVMDENDAVIYTISGLKTGDKLGVGEKATLSVIVTYDYSVTSQPVNTVKDLTVTINYVQDLEKNSDTPTYDYAIGDRISFAGSSWYVIKNSTSEEDYVTLMKEKVLTNAELGEYAYNDTYDTMSYYWSDACHPNGYGYTFYVESGCRSHNDYKGSKVREFLEGTYVNTLGSDNLKKVDGYKIRLITLEELNTNLEWINLNKSAKTHNENSNVPTWVYQDYGNSNGVYGYWTMSTFPYASSAMWNVDQDTNVHGNIVNYPNCGVRPVINLLKSSI